MTSTPSRQQHADGLAKTASSDPRDRQFPVPCSQHGVDRVASFATSQTSWSSTIPVHRIEAPGHSPPATRGSLRRRRHVRHDANDRIVYDTSTGNLYYDADAAAGAAQSVVTLITQTAATDIVVIGQAAPPPPVSHTIVGTAGNDSLTGTEGNRFRSAGWRAMTRSMPWAATTRSMAGPASTISTAVLASRYLHRHRGRCASPIRAASTRFQAISAWTLADGFENLSADRHGQCRGATGNNAANVLTGNSDTTSSTREAATTPSRPGREMT